MCKTSDVILPVSMSCIMVAPPCGTGMKQLKQQTNKWKEMKQARENNRMGAEEAMPCLMKGEVPEETHEGTRDDAIGQEGTEGESSDC